IHVLGTVELKLRIDDMVILAGYHRIGAIVGAEIAIVFVPPTPAPMNARSLAVPLDDLTPPIKYIVLGYQSDKWGPRLSIVSGLDVTPPVILERVAHAP